MAKFKRGVSQPERVRAFHATRISRAQLLIDRLERIVAALGQGYWTVSQANRLAELDRDVTNLVTDLQVAEIAEALSQGAHDATAVDTPAA